MSKRKDIEDYKRARGCAICGMVRRARDLLLVRPDGSGTNLSRLVARSRVSSEHLWEEIAKCSVVCRRCYRPGRPWLETAQNTQETRREVNQDGTD